jgi:hypothetical protein
MTVINVASKGMTMSEIKIKAKALGVAGSKMKKVELIHAIQKAEGFTACYGRSTGSCPWTQCCWRSDCFKTRP